MKKIIIWIILIIILMGCENNENLEIKTSGGSILIK